MKFNVFKNTVLLFVLVMISCASKVKNSTNEKGEIIEDVKIDSTLIVGANQTENYLPLLKGKRIGVVANQTSVIFKKHNWQQKH